VPQETQALREARERVELFAEWVDTCERILSARLRHLGRRAELAKDALRFFPDLELAWIALAEFYHNQNELTAALDALSFEKASQWLEYPMGRMELFRAFEEAARASER
jgi:hypothetical protein